MTKMKRLTALALTALLLVAVLASCSAIGILNGTYTNISGEITEGTGTVYEFKLNKVTVTTYAFGNVINQYSGTYSIKDGEITITSDELFIGSIHDQSTNQYFRTSSFAEGDGYITIGSVSYNKR